MEQSEKIRENRPRDVAKRRGALMATRAALRTYGVYSLIPGTSKMVIRRQDPDHARTVALIDSLAHWDRFVAALDSGHDEVAAVHKIDVTGGEH